MKTFLVGCGLVAAESLIAGWLLMVVVGIVHAEWLTELPTVGYGGAFIIAIAVDLFITVHGLFFGAAKAVVGDES